MCATTNYISGVITEFNTSIKENYLNISLRH